MKPAALPLFALLSLPVPDLVVSGVRNVVVEAQLDAAALVRTHCHGHRIAKDETLMEIARQRLGDAGRWQQIEQLNPGLDAVKLPVGQVIWLPPTDPKAAAGDPAKRVFAYVDAEPGPRHSARPLIDGMAIGARRRDDRFLVFLVPLVEQAGFEQEWLRTAVANRVPDAVLKLVEGKRITSLTGQSAGSRVPTDHPMVRRVDRHVIEAKGDGVFALGCRSTGFDKEGREVSLELPTRQREDALLLLVLAAVGGGVLLWRSRRPELAPA